MTQEVSEAVSAPQPLFPVNRCPSPDALPVGFLEFYKPHHDEFTPWQERCLIRRRAQLLHAAEQPVDHWRDHPIHQDKSWKCTVPSWAQDQRNQMTGPADDGELVVKMLNAGTADKPMPGVMIDLEDSQCNRWEHTVLGTDNAVAAHKGTLTYVDKKGQTVGIKPSGAVLFTRVRGLHMQQHGIYAEPTSASLFDLALFLYKLFVVEKQDPAKLRHPICIYIPKSETAEDAVWWDAAFSSLEKAVGLPDGHIRCMALVESLPMAYRMEEFLFYLHKRIIGLNFGRWDYIASALHHHSHDPNWVLCDRNLVPKDAPFLQNVRSLLTLICHSRGALAIGGMTALYPSRADAELNARALTVLAADKKNEADCGMDGAWTGHPDQNAIAVAQFPYPNQLHVLPNVDRYVDLRPAPAGLGPVTLEGTVAAAKTCIRYRAAVLAGKGAVLIDGYMEDLATDRIYRNMIAQRIKHGHHTELEVREAFVTAMQQIATVDWQGKQHACDVQTRFSNAIDITLDMIRTQTCDPS